MKTITTYKPRTILGNKRPKYKQDANNCRLYAGLNDLYFNTGIVTDAEDFELYLKNKRISPHAWNVSYTAGEMLLKYFPEKWLDFFRLDILTDTKLFAQLLKAGYSLIYTRVHNTDLLNDIMYDKRVDKVFTKRYSTTHVAVIRFEGWKIREKWSWGNDNRFNEFHYKDIDTFIACVKAGAIRSDIRFLDFKQ